MSDGMKGGPDAPHVHIPDPETAALVDRLLKDSERLHWLHDCSNGTLDAEGFEWGIFRVKWENGQPVQVWQTLSDFSDLDAEMKREAAQSPTQT